MNMISKIFIGHLIGITHIHDVKKLRALKIFEVHFVHCEMIDVETKMQTTNFHCTKITKAL